MSRHSSAPKLNIICQELSHYIFLYPNTCMLKTVMWVCFYRILTYVNKTIVLNKEEDRFSTDKRYKKPVFLALLKPLNTVKSISSDTILINLAHFFKLTVLSRSYTEVSHVVSLTYRTLTLFSLNTKKYLRSLCYSLFCS